MTFNQFIAGILYEAHKEYCFKYGYTFSAHRVAFEYLYTIYYHAFMYMGNKFIPGGREY